MAVGVKRWDYELVEEPTKHHNSYVILRFCRNPTPRIDRKPLARYSAT